MKIQVALIVCLGVFLTTARAEYPEDGLDSVDLDQKINDYRRFFTDGGLFKGLVDKVVNGFSSLTGGFSGEGVLGKLVALGVHGAKVATKEASVGVVNFLSNPGDAANGGYVRAQTWPGQLAARIVLRISKAFVSERLAQKFARIAQEVTDRFVVGFYNFLQLPESLADNPFSNGSNNKPKSKKPSTNQPKRQTLPRYQAPYVQGFSYYN